MFRRLGYPWTLQLNKIMQESQQWLDIKFDETQYEIINTKLTS